MTDFVSFKITGIENISKKLKKIPLHMRLKGLRAASRKAMNIVNADARARAKAFDDPNTKNQIWKLISTQESKRGSRRVGGVLMRVGVRGGAMRSKEKFPPWYWRLIEFGSETQPANPFMRPALESNISAVTNMLVSETDKEITKALAGL